MKFYCTYTPAHEVLYRDWFLPSVPEGVEVVAIPSDISGSGDFLSEEFLRCIRAKVSMIVDSIDQNHGEWITWTDIDILLFPNLAERLGTIIANAGNKCLFFQMETKREGEVNTGFILIRCGEETAAFFREVGARLEREKGKNEQAVENEMLREGAAPAWGYLPVDFVARTHGWPPPREMAIYHANYTLGPDGVGQKIRQFRHVNAMRRWGAPAVLYFTALRALEKLAAKLSGR
ncbi:MAG: putative nucleotide-diphospho-sugar transferase [Luteolibacter sp.]